MKLILLLSLPLAAQVSTPPTGQSLWQIERAALIASKAVQSLTAEFYLAQLKLRQAEREASEAMDKWNAARAAKIAECGGELTDKYECKPKAPASPVAEPAPSPPSQ